MTLVMTETINTNHPLYLFKPKSSLFTELECREYPNYELIYGFINNKMGIRIRKKFLQTYGDEQTHYKHYIRKIKWFDDLQYVSVNYYLPKHGWGRTNAFGSLSLSLFRRPPRHSFCNGSYIDCDIRNCQIQIVLEKAIQLGFTENEGIDGLIEYCNDPKKSRQNIINHYSLEDIIEEDGYKISAKDQAKQLPIRLAFGGGFITWKNEYKVKRVDDLQMIKKIEKCLRIFSSKINEINPHIRADLEEDEKFQIKSEEEKLRSVTALYAQTLERLIQEECVSYLVKNYKNVVLNDIIPSQDGMMILKNQIKDVNIPLLFECFNQLIKRKYKLNIHWEVKPFDEAIPIIPSKKMPVDVFLEDLEKGERYIAELISPAFKNEIKFYQNEKLKVWYNFEKTGLWEEGNYPPITRIIKQLQDYIEEEILRCLNDWKKEKDEEEKKKLLKKEALIKKFYKSVGSSSYSKQLCLYLEYYLKDNNFIKKLNKTAGKFPFKDGILDLKTGIFKKGFRYDDYLTFTTQIDYLGLNVNNDRKQYILDKLKQITNNNQTHLNYYLSIIGYSLTGDASLEKQLYYIIDGTELKAGNNGKTFLFTLLMEIFPEYIQQTDIKTIEDGYNKAHKNIATWKNKRIVFIDEGTKKKINASLIKKIGDGLSIEYEVMYSTTEILNVMFKLFVCSNHTFKVGEGEDAVFNRYRQLNFASHFDLSGERDEDEPEKLLFKGDKNLTQNILKNYKDELISIIMDYSIKYYKEGIPEIPADYLQATAETQLANNPFATWFLENYEQKDDNRIKIEEIITNSNYSRKDVLIELKRLKIKYNKSLFNDGDRGGIIGWSLKSKDT